MELANDSLGRVLREELALLGHRIQRLAVKENVNSIRGNLGHLGEKRGEPFGEHDLLLVSELQALNRNRRHASLISGGMTIDLPLIHFSKLGFE